MAPKGERLRGEGSHGTKRCPFCAEEILEAAKKCKHCGSIVDEPLDLTEEYPTQVVSGQTLNERYVISQRIARGGMAEIFKARDLELDMDVVLKVVPPALADDPRQIKYLREEAKIAIQLTHQNIVRIYGFDASSDTKFIVMEYISGENLYQLVNKTPAGKFQIGQVIGWLEPVCDAFDYAHSLGVIHRDIKPSNIMVNDEGVVKVADFGIARRIQDSMKAISQQTVRGTPNYMSPEQLRGEKLTIQSDIYSLGATVYMLLSGRAPFTSTAVSASLGRPAPDAISGIPPRFFRALKRSLDMDPHKRFPSAGDFFQVAKDAAQRPVSTRHQAVESPAAQSTTADAQAQKTAREVPIRVEAEEIPDQLDAASVALKEKAAKAAAEGDFEKAVMLYEQLSAMLPEDTEVFCCLGECRARAGLRADAIHAFQQAIRANPGSLRAWYQMGLAQEQAGGPERAIRAYKRAIEIRQESPGLNPEITLSKLKGQIQNVQWKMKQMDEDRSGRLLEVRQRKERHERAAAEKRQKMMREITIVLFVLLALLIALGIAEFFFNILKYIPF